MAHLLPPYTKNHIIIFGSLALLASFILLFLANGTLSKKKEIESTVTPVSAKELQNNTALKDSLVDVQEGKAEVTWAAKNFVILDIRPEEEFNKQHLKGAHNAPLAFLRAASLNPDVDMVVYSDNKDNLTKASSILADKGIRDIYLLHDSLAELQEQGYKVEGSEGQ